MTNEEKWASRVFPTILRRAQDETGSQGWRFLGVRIRRAILTEKAWGMVMGLDESTGGILIRMEALQSHISKWETENA